MADRPETGRELRRGWTTGACATGAAKAAYTARLTGSFPDPVTIALPKGETPSFPLAKEELGDGFTRAGIVKDAGDDPDVTHRALILVTVSAGAPGAGVTFRAGPGVGTVTRPGLPLDVGEPAINPAPRRMIAEAIAEVAAAHGGSGDVTVEIAVADGAALAEKTWNPRLGIVGGISILGTTGVVHPFSCSAWIHSIQRGIDVARAEGLARVGAATGATSEAAVKALYGLPDHALIDMGDFAGGMLKYLRVHPLPKVAIAGGFAKLAKLGQGMLDLHSGRGQVDFDWLAARAAERGAAPGPMAAIREANTAMEVLEAARRADIDLAPAVAGAARATALETLRGAPVEVEIVVVDRAGEIIARAS